MTERTGDDATEHPDETTHSEASSATDDRAAMTPLTPLTAGPPRLVSLISTAAAALILLVAIAVTVLSWPDWIGEAVLGEGHEGSTAQSDAPAEGG